MRMAFFTCSTVMHQLMMLVSIAVLCLLNVPALKAMSFPNIIPTPPYLPQQFSINFSEILVLGTKVLGENNGSWHYDWTKRRARFDHGEGQVNNFCGGQGLSPKDVKAPCSLLFTPDEKMYVLYPQSMTCCMLCGKEQGCTMLKPDWIHTGSKLLSVEMISGSECYGYGKPGAVAPADILYSNVAGEMCRYHEVVEHIDHNLTFYRESVKYGPPPDYLFDVPEVCNRTCPHPHNPPHF